MKMDKVHLLDANTRDEAVETLRTLLSGQSITPTSPKLRCAFQHVLHGEVEDGVGLACCRNPPNLASLFVIGHVLEIELELLHEHALSLL